MHLSSLVLLAVLLLLDYGFRKKFPALHKNINRKIELPAAILLSLLVATYCGFLVYSVYEMLTSSVSRGDKVFFVIFIAVVISIYGVIMFFCWKNLLKRRKEEHSLSESPAPEETD